MISQFFKKLNIEELRYCQLCNSFNKIYNYECYQVNTFDFNCLNNCEFRIRVNPKIIINDIDLKVVFTIEYFSYKNMNFYPERFDVYANLGVKEFHYKNMPENYFTDCSFRQIVERAENYLLLQ